jgi:hypothetical protein
MSSDMMFPVSDCIWSMCDMGWWCESSKNVRIRLIIIIISEVYNIESLIVRATLARPLCDQNKLDVILAIQQLNCKMNLFESRHATCTARGTIWLRRSPPGRRCCVFCRTPWYDIISCQQRSHCVCICPVLDESMNHQNTWKYWKYNIYN